MKEKSKTISVKDTVINILSNSKKPISASDILKKIFDKGLFPNKTSVYRSIYSLEKNGLIKNIFIDNKNKLYEIVNEDEHHHHIVCLKCSKIEDFEAPINLEKYFKDFQKKISKKNKFNITDHSFEFFGYCNKCMHSIK